jgi:hypothetical protein
MSELGPGLDAAFAPARRWSRDAVLWHLSSLAFLAKQSLLQGGSLNNAATRRFWLGGARYSHDWCAQGVTA